MHAMTQAVQHAFVAQLLNEKQSDSGIKDWLTRGSFSVLTSGNSFVLDQLNAHELARHTLFDLSRFSSSGWESYFASALNANSGPAIGVATSNLYYAAFYFAHVMMRSTGRHVLWIDAHTARQINSIAAIFGAGANHVSKGEYLLDTSQLSSTNLTAVLQPARGSGGAHQKFWREFREFVFLLEGSATASNLPWATDIISWSSELTAVLRIDNSQDFQWLSDVRNAITYNHYYSAWWSSPKSSPARQALDALGRKEIHRLRIDEPIRALPMTAFTNACQMIVEIGIEVAERIVANTADKKKFATGWTRMKDMLAIENQPAL